MEKITEKDGVYEDWYIEAGEQTLKTLPKFLDKLANKYGHDYGTICHAIAAAAIGGAWAVERSPSGGITGFQASCVMWEFIRRWNYSGNKCGLKITDYDNLLYPQYEQYFEKTIDSETWQVIQEEAAKKIKEGRGNESVTEHWKSIIAGQLPFGFVIKND